MSILQIVNKLKVKLSCLYKTFHNERLSKLLVKILHKRCNIIKLLMIKMTKMKQNLSKIKIIILLINLCLVKIIHQLNIKELIQSNNI